MNKIELLEKSSDTEKILLAKVLDKIELAKTKNKIVSTNFLDEHEQKVALDLLKKAKIKNYVFFGGIDNAERKIIIIYPEKLSSIFDEDIPNKEEYINLIRIQLPKQLSGKYTHRDYLGGVMKTGIAREKIGDIIVYDEGADILVIPEITKYLQYNLPELTRFSKAKIKIENLANIKQKEEKFEELEIIVPSMRLDSIISELIRVSRNKGTDIIRQERVFVNFIEEVRISKEVKEEDIITIRGKGRYKIIGILRKTKNNRIVVKVQKYV